MTLPAPPRLRRTSRSFRIAVTLLFAVTFAAIGAAHASVFYRFDVVAQTGVANFTSFGNGPSINDAGKVAFVGRVSGGESVYHWTPVAGVSDIASNFFSPNRSFGEAVQINDNDEILTWNRLLPIGLYEARVFRAPAANDSSILVRGISGNLPYDLLYQYPSINNTRLLEDRANGRPGNKDGICGSGEVCVSQIAYNALRDLPNRYLGTVVQTPTDAADAGQQNEYGLNTSLSRPMISDDGRIVVRGRNSTDPILLFEYPLDPPKAIADSAAGFTALGNAPGITEDGRIVAFAGNRGNGDGIFLSMEMTGGQRRLVRIVGENASFSSPELGFASNGGPLYMDSIELDSRVGIVYTPDADGNAKGSVVVSFIGTPNAASPLNPGTGKPFLFSAKKGLWTIRIDLTAPLYRNVCVVKKAAGATLPPAVAGDTIASVNGVPYIDAGSDGICQSDNNDSTEALFSRTSPIPVVQVDDAIKTPSGMRTVTNVAVHDPLAPATSDHALNARAARIGDHRVVFFAQAGAEQMIVAGEHLDSDQDGLLDHWETTGIDLDGDGGVDLDLAAMGADPLKRDLFMQIDWGVDRPGPLNLNETHRTRPGVIRRIAQHYASAPALASGVPAGIQLHVDAGNEYDLAGQPFSRNMGTGPIVGGNIVGGQPIDILYFGQPGSVTFPGVVTQDFQTVKQNNMWSHHRGAREFAFTYIIWTDHHHGAGVGGGSNNSAPVTGTATDGSPFLLYDNNSVDVGTGQYGGTVVKITAGTGAGQVRFVAADGLYNGKRALEVSEAFTVVPDTTSQYILLHTSAGEGQAGRRYDGAFSPGKNLLITLGGWSVGPDQPLASFVDEWKTIAHEVGHLTTLMHGGVDHVNNKVGYVSLMNYAYETCALGQVATDVNGNPLAGAAACPIDRYSSHSDAVSADWEHIDLLSSHNFQRSAQAFGTLSSTSPFPAPAEQETQTPLTIEKRFGPRDLLPPVVQLTSPAGGATFAVGTPIGVTFTATDNVGVTRAEVWFDRNGDGRVDEATEIFAAIAGGGNAYSATLPATSGPSGSRRISVLAYDALDNPGVASLVVNVGSVASVAVPSVVGQSESAARASLVTAGFAIGAVAYQPSGSVPAGSVIAQSVPGGQLLAPGSPVGLTLSLGATGVLVPKLVGLSQAAAVSAITGAGLVVGTVTVAAGGTGGGNVRAQSPLAAAIAPAGSPVHLLVNPGAGSVAVPDVVGLTQASATSAITGAGLVVGTITQQASSTVPAGSVIAQNPTAGQLVAPGSAVNLVISSGPGNVAVPDVVGLTQASATTAITGAGLIVGTVTQQPSSTVPAGSVIAQNPLGGQQVPPGSAVNLVVSSGPALATVPDVVGLTQVSATTAITGAGLIVGTVTQQPSSTVPAGSVIAQNPLGGQQVPPGSAVNLVVSSGVPVIVPTFVGATQADAIDAIIAAGFRVGSITFQQSTTVPAGIVIAQNPAAGQQIPAGSAVDLVVSSGAAALDIPALSPTMLALLAVMLAIVAWRVHATRRAFARGGIRHVR
jgi:beta-lactam-binding protein with PASTA domain